MKKNMTETTLTVTTATLTLSSVAKHGTIAIFGALAHSIRAHRDGQSKGLMDFALLTIMSSFSGVIFALVALNTFGNEYITLAAAGAGGFLGVEGLTMLAEKIRDSLSDFITKRP